MGRAHPHVRLGGAVLTSAARVAAASGPVAASAPASGPGADRHPVTTSLTRLALPDVDPAALSTLRRTEPSADPERLTAPRATRAYSLVGVTWRASDHAPDMRVDVRTRDAAGWSSWHALDLDGAASAPGGGGLAPADDTARTRAGTEPFYAGPSTGVQVRVDADRRALPSGLRVDLVDPGTSPLDDDAPSTRQPSAEARSVEPSSSESLFRPTIHTRAEWGADESKRNGFAGYGTTVKVGWVHHTVTANGYSRGEVPALIRGIYAYHTGSLGWSDIGYNVLVDRFGRIWEGRWGGVSQPVVGAHTRGYNTDTFGVGALGNYATHTAPDALVHGLGEVMGWKLGLYGRDPHGTATLTSGVSGSDQRYPKGATVRLPVISGHRDVIYTACPGTHLYARRGDVRDAAAAQQSPLGQLPLSSE